MGVFTKEKKCDIIKRMSSGDNINTLNRLTPQEVAEYFLTKDDLSPKKIQKLVYYAYAWFIALNNQDENSIENVLFDEQPEAWLHGPVFPSLYATYKEYGWREIRRQRRKNTGLDKETVAFLDEIWKVFGGYTADQLEYMTHKEDPWMKARKNLSSSAVSSEKISNKEIFVFYNELAKK